MHEHPLARRPPRDLALQGGPTELWNLLLLCRFHHTSVHHRDFSIEGRDGDVRFSRPDGSEIPEAPHPVTATGPGVVERNAQIGLSITAATAVPSWDGSPLTRFGLGVAVEGLLRHKGLLN